MIIVSGMHRSGTSCITGLLERCGFSLGTSHPIHPIKNVWNPKGYFENMQMLAINDTILKHAGGRWDQVPPERNIEITGDRLAKAVSDFGTQFNGEVAKDPRTCVTIAVWEKHCPPLDRIVFCLRNPLGVARSLQKRDGTTLEFGANLWYEYVARFFKTVKKSAVTIVDYDNLPVNFDFEMTNLLAALGRPLSAGQIRERAGDFFETKLSHTDRDDPQFAALPDHVRLTYEAIRKRTYAGRQAGKNA